MDKIEYKMISDDYHEDFNTFTLKKGETYFLLGRNGIGKSTLIKYFSDRYHESHYDIEFDVVVTRADLKKYFKKTKIPSKDLDRIVSKWDESPLTIRYNSLGRNGEDYFEEIKNEVTALIAKANKEVLLNIFKDLANTAAKSVDIIKSRKTAINDKLNSNVKYKDIDNGEYYKVDRLKRDLDYLKEQSAEISKLQSNTDKIINKIEKDIDVEYSELPSFHRGFYNAPKGTEALAKNLDKLSREASQIFYEQSGGTNFYFNNLLYNVLINIGVHVDIQQKYTEFAPKEKNLSRGQEVLAMLTNVAKKAKEKTWKTGYAFDEPFNSLDSQNIDKARTILDTIPGTKLITSHNTNAIKATDLKNVIVMFDYKGKRGIANYTDLKKLSKPDRLGVTAVSDQINAILNNWFSRYKGNVLIVEGYKDYAILNEALNGIEVIPMGGAYLISGAISYYSTKSDKIRFLFDKDSAGNFAASEVAINLPHGNITKKVFGKSKMKNFEELITDKEFGDDKDLKNEMFKEIMEGNHKEKVNEIVGIIEKQFEK